MENEFREHIEVLADVIHRYWGLDRGRVLKVLERTAKEDFSPDPDSPDGEEPDLVYEVTYQPDILQALQSVVTEKPTFKPINSVKDFKNVNTGDHHEYPHQKLTPEEREKTEAVLQIFEKADDLEYLRTKINLTQYLSGIAPLYSLDTLADVIEEFADHLQLNRDAIIKTGHQTFTFSPAPWLDCRLSKLYPVKMPWGIKTVDAEYPYIKVINNGRLECPPWYCYHLDRLHQTEKGNIRTDYIWGDPTIGGVLSYEEAPFMHGINSEFAVWIESVRDRLLKLRMDVLDVLYKHLRRGDSNGMWKEIVSLFRTNIEYEEACALLNADQYYFAGSDSPFQVAGQWNARSKGYHPTVMSPGGLTDILTVVGHCEQELRLGTLARTREALDDIIQVTYGPPQKVLIPSYVQLAVSGNKEKIDKACEIFMARSKREEEFWKEFERRVNEFIKNELYREVSVKTKVAGKHVPHFEAKVEHFSLLLKEGHFPSSDDNPDKDQQEPTAKDVPFHLKDPEDRLRGWEEIRTFVSGSMEKKISENTARSWEKRGMPVHREGRVVWASRAELSAWLFRNAKSN